jgi:hypothetical protein
LTTAESTYNRIILDPVRLAPGSHNPLVIARNEDDLVYTRRLELVKIVDVRRDVRDLAGRLAVMLATLLISLQNNVHKP